MRRRWLVNTGLTSLLVFCLVPTLMQWTKGSIYTPWPEQSDISVYIPAEENNDEGWILLGEGAPHSGYDSARVVWFSNEHSGGTITQAYGLEFGDLREFDRLRGELLPREMFGELTEAEVEELSRLMGTIIALGEDLELDEAPLQTGISKLDTRPQSVDQYLVVNLALWYAMGEQGIDPNQGVFQFFEDMDNEEKDFRVLVRGGPGAVLDLVDRAKAYESARPQEPDGFRVKAVFPQGDSGLTPGEDGSYSSSPFVLMLQPEGIDQVSCTVEVSLEARNAQGETLTQDGISLVDENGDVVSGGAVAPGEQVQVRVDQSFFQRNGEDCRVVVSCTANVYEAEPVFYGFHPADDKGGAEDIKLVGMRGWNTAFTGTGSFTLSTSGGNASGESLGTGEQHNITVTVYTENREPLTGAKLSVSYGEASIQAAVTDDQGVATFRLPKDYTGEYQLSEVDPPEENKDAAIAVTFKVDSQGNVLIGQEETRGDNVPFSLTVERSMKSYGAETTVPDRDETIASDDAEIIDAGSDGTETAPAYEEEAPVQEEPPQDGDGEVAPEPDSQLEPDLPDTGISPLDTMRIAGAVMALVALAMYNVTWRKERD